MAGDNLVYLFNASTGNWERYDIGLACTVPDIDLDLTTQTITVTLVYEACRSIAAGPAFAIVSPGVVTFRAPSVVLKNGFSVGPGAEFTVVSEVP